MDAREALIDALKKLPRTAHFNVVSFGSNYKTMFDKPTIAKAATVKAAIKKVSNMDADMGGTEVLLLYTGQC